MLRFPLIVAFVTAFLAAPTPFFHYSKGLGFGALLWWQRYIEAGVTFGLVFVAVLVPLLIVGALVRLVARS